MELIIGLIVVVVILALLFTNKKPPATETVVEEPAPTPAAKAPRKPAKPKKSA
jgi:hypothetical protein